MDAHASMASPGAAAFVAMWGVMMAAMMLPSASPMILLYGAVSSKLRAPEERAIPPLVFGGVYVALWIVAGIPVYLASTVADTLYQTSPAFRSASPYVVALLLAAAGLYQFSSLKTRCLRVCESPISFLMRRWKSGYLSTLELAAAHGAYCLGCCWALMMILVAGGAMNMAWVVVITAIVSAEKLLPFGARAARATGWVLIALAIAVAANPRLAMAMRGGQSGSMASSMNAR